MYVILEKINSATVSIAVAKPLHSDKSALLNKVTMEGPGGRTKWI